MVRRLALGLLVLGLVFTAPAAGDVYQRKQSIDDQIQSLHDKIVGAQAQEGALTTKISALNGQIRTLEGQVGSANDRLVAFEQDLALHRQKLDRLTQLFRLESRRLAFLRRQYREAVRRLDSRLVAMYEAENPDTVAVLFSATSLSDLIDQLDYVHKIGAEDKRIAGEVDVAKKDMAVARARPQQNPGGGGAGTPPDARPANEQGAGH